MKKRASMLIEQRTIDDVLYILTHPDDTTFANKKFRHWAREMSNVKTNEEGITKPYEAIHKPNNLLL